MDSNETKALDDTKSSLNTNASLSSEDDSSKKYFEDVVEEDPIIDTITDLGNQIDSIENVLKSISKSEFDDSQNKEKELSETSEKNVKQNLRNLSLESELNVARKERNELIQRNRENDEKILELGGEFEAKYDEINKKDKELLQLQSRKESQHLVTASSGFSANSSYLETSSNQPTSLPSFASPYNKDLPKLRSIENELKIYEADIEKLKRNNIELQLQNGKLDEKIEKLKLLESQQNEKVQQLNRQVNSNSSESMRLNPMQQRYFDDFRGRLQHQADDFKEQRDKSIRESQEKVALALRQQTEAEKKKEGFEQRILRLESEKQRVRVQMEELRTALVVATRVSPQSVSARNKATIDSLRSTARRLETDIRKVTREYESGLEEKRRLEEQIRGHGTSRIVQRTTYPGGGSTTIERRNNNVVILNEGVNITQDLNDDFEFD